MGIELIQLIDKLNRIVAYEDLKFNESMSLHTSFKVGGAADIFVTPQSYYQLAQIVRISVLNQVPYMILGKGSNLIVRDGGIRGLVISTAKLQRMLISQDFLLADAGVELTTLSSFAADYGLSGLEFACGIPGSVGGAVFMNAGAYEGEIAQVLDFTVCLDLDKLYHYEPVSSDNPHLDSAFPYKIIALDNNEHAFSYRKSIYQTRNLIMLYAVFLLKQSNQKDIKTKIQELTTARETKQPLQYPSAGSIFKRPPGHFTGALIQQCNLSGYQIGGAAVSELHCGFIVNTGSATATDIINLIEHIQAVVYAAHGVKLSTEVKIIGCDNPPSLTV